MSRHWDSFPLTENATGNAEEVLRQLPRFEKVPVETFAFAPNPHRQFVVARTAGGEVRPAGWVSPSYELIQHTDVLERAVDFAKSLPGRRIERIEALWSPAGERFHSVLHLAGGTEVAPDGLPLRLQLLCRNSVDGHAAADLRLGWFRLICSNGLTVGFSLGKTKLRHRCGASLLDSLERLREQLGEVEADAETMKRWAEKPVNRERLERWTNGTVTKAWGVGAASRVWHICTEGRDAAMAPPFERAPATQRRVKLLDPVPGSERPARNLYAVSQALSWVATHRRNINAVEEATLDVPRLIGWLG